MNTDPIFDPNTWVFPTIGHLWGPQGECCTVDYEDYLHFVQWKWTIKQSQNSPKFYFRRTFRDTTLYLHVAIMKRTEIVRPSLFHCTVDHIDGDSFNNRRINLRWATYSEQSFSAWKTRRADENGRSRDV